MQASESCLGAALTPFFFWLVTHTAAINIAEREAGEKLQLFKSVTETYSVNLVMQKVSIIVLLPHHLKTNVLQHRPHHYVYVF